MPPTTSPVAHSLIMSRSSQPGRTPPRAKEKQWAGTELNRRHGTFQAPALPTELHAHANRSLVAEAPFTVKRAM